MTDIELIDKICLDVGLTASQEDFILESALEDLRIKKGQYPQDD